MVKRLVAFGTLAAGAGALLAGVALAASPFTNGSFESGPNPAFGWYSIYPGNPALTGWTVTSGSVDQYRAWQASDGNYSIDLDGNSPGAIAQTFDTVPGVVYIVRFDLSGNPDPDTVFPPGWSPVKRVEVSATGGTPQVFAYDILANGNTHTDMKYETHDYVFVAAGTSTTVQFRSLSTAGWWGPVLDNVRVSGFGADLCKKGGWQSLSDSHGQTFKNQGDCVSFVATKGKNVGAGD